MRLTYIDLLKGFTIVWVLWMHMNLPELIFPSVQMPIFFFISGTFYKIHGNCLSQIKSDSRKLLVPAVCFGFISWLIINAKVGVSGGIINHIVEAEKASIIWFLIALFLFRLLSYPFTKRNLRYGLLLLSAIVYVPGFYLYAKHLDFIVPIIPLAHMGCFMIYYAIGLCFGKKILNVVESKGKNTLLILAICIYISLVHIIDWKTGVFSYIPFLVYVFPYTLGVIFALLKLFYKVQRYATIMKPVRYFGENSIVFYLTHWPLWMHVFKPLGGDLYVSFIAIVLLEFPLIYIINNYLPWMIGKKKR